MSTNIPNRRRRGRLFVEKDFQYRFTLRITLIAGMIFALFTGVALFFIKLSYEMLIQGAILQMPDMVDKLKWEFRALSMGMIVAMVAFATTIFFVSIFLTRQVAGPLFAVRRRLHEFGLGHQNVRIRLRTGDEFHNLQLVFNEAMEQHDTRTNLLRDRLLQLRRLLNEERLDEARRLLREMEETPVQNLNPSAGPRNTNKNA